MSLILIDTILQHISKTCLYCISLFRIEHTCNSSGLTVTGTGNGTSNLSKVVLPFMYTLLHLTGSEGTSSKFDRGTSIELGLP